MIHIGIPWNYLHVEDLFPGISVSCEAIRKCIARNRSILRGKLRYQTYTPHTFNGQTVLLYYKSRPSRPGPLPFSLHAKFSGHVPYINTTDVDHLTSHLVHSHHSTNFVLSPFWYHSSRCTGHWQQHFFSNAISTIFNTRHNSTNFDLSPFRYSLQLHLFQ